MANISLAKGSEWYYVGGDYTEAFIGNSVVETEILDYVIPADTVIHGIKIYTATIITADIFDVPNTGIIRIKAGADGAEVERVRMAGTAPASATANYIDGVQVIFQCVIDDLDWTAAQSISITGENSSADGSTRCYGEVLIIEGF